MAYEPDRTTVETWLNAGGSELVFEVLRQMGWRVEVCDEFRDNEVAISSYCKGYEGTFVNSKKSGYAQAVAAVVAFQGDHTYIREAKEVMYPLFLDGDDARIMSLGRILGFCDTVRHSLS